eukprot:scaffold9828_cov105-Isochrysis_galbana.AAC.5
MRRRRVAAGGPACTCGRRAPECAAPSIPAPGEACGGCGRAGAHGWVRAGRPAGRREGDRARTGGWRRDRLARAVAARSAGALAMVSRPGRCSDAGSARSPRPPRRPARPPRRRVHLARQRCEARTPR